MSSKDSPSHRMESWVEARKQSFQNCISMKIKKKKVEKNYKIQVFIIFFQFCIFVFENHKIWEIS